MFLDKHMVMQINRVLLRIALPISICDERGVVVLPENTEKTFDMPREVQDYTGVPLVLDSCVYIRADSTPPLYLRIEGSSAMTVDCAVLACALVSSLSHANMPHADREEAFRRMLREEVDGAELEAMAQEHHIEVERMRCVMVLHLLNVGAETMQTLLQDHIPWTHADALVEMDRHTLVLIKALDEQYGFEELEQLAGAIQNTMLTDTSYQVFLGLGEPRRSLVLIGESFREARRAIDVGRMYRPDISIYVYRRLLLERFLADVSREMGARYNGMMFNRKTARLFNEEMIHTIEKFFENSLNLSETARQLYIHRNTLVYRLDKVQRVTGLDLRAFDDAVTFKMMMLLGKSGMDKPRPVH